MGILTYSDENTAPPSKTRSKMRLQDTQESATKHHLSLLHPSRAWQLTPVISALKRWGRRDHQKFNANMAHSAGSRPARAAWWDLASKQKENTMIQSTRWPGPSSTLTHRKAPKGLLTDSGANGNIPISQLKKQWLNTLGHVSTEGHGCHYPSKRRSTSKGPNGFYTYIYNIYYTHIYTYIYMYLLLRNNLILLLLLGKQNPNKQGFFLPCNCPVVNYSSH